MGIAAAVAAKYARSIAATEAAIGNTRSVTLAWSLDAVIRGATRDLCVLRWMIHSCEQAITQM